MKLRWIIAAGGLALLLRSSSRRTQSAAAAPELRRHFPRIARLRLVAACPDLDQHLDNRTLEPLFDWIVGEMCRRRGACDFPALLQWATEQGQPEMDLLTSDVTRDALDHLPRRALEIIDGCHGRTYAAAVLDLALAEAGRRAASEATRPDQRGRPV